MLITERSYIDWHTHRRDLSHTTVYQADVTQLDSTDAYFTVGIHPLQVDKSDFSDWSHFMRCMHLKNCIAIGECGLDNRYGRMEQQEYYYLEQLKIADTVGKPVVLHCVGLIDRCIQLYIRSGCSQRLLFHGFSKVSRFDGLLEYPFLQFGIGARLLSDRHLQELVAKKLPLERLFIETDDSGIEIGLVYRLISELKGLHLQELISQQHINFKEVFNVSLA